MSSGLHAHTFVDLRFYFDFALTPPDSCWTFRAEGQQKHVRNFPRVFQVLTVRDAVRGSLFYFLPLVTAMELPLCPQREVLYLEYLRHGDPPSPVHRRGSPRGEDSPWSRDFKTWYARILVDVHRFDRFHLCPDGP